MKAFRTSDPKLFLQKIQSALEQDEAANQAMLALCQKLIEGRTPPAGTVMTWAEDTQGLTAAALLVPPAPLWLFCEPMTKNPSLRLLINMLRDENITRIKGKSHTVESFSLLWSEMLNGSAQVVGQEKVFSLSRCAQIPFVPGYMQKAIPADADQLSEWFKMYKGETKNLPYVNLDNKFILNETTNGNILVWEDGLMVSMICETLSTRHGSALDFLFTPPVLRGRGYASALANTLCQQILEQGSSFCSATIDPAREAANHLLQKLGFTIVCELDEIELIK
jgi:predicted GNAT family acetyltransferase